MRLIAFFFTLMIGVYGMTPFEIAMEDGYTPSRYKNSKKFKQAYEKGHFEIKPSCQEPIPKIIHQIWIGGEPPKSFHELMNSWKEIHPDWEYKLWRDADIADFAFINKKPFLLASNMGAKADIWRYEILYQYGGVYVDVDFEAIAPLDPIIQAHPFFAGIGGFDYVNNAIIGAKKGHPILKNLISIMGQLSKSDLDSPWYHTGPLAFSKQVYQHLKYHPQDGIIYPVRFFYPLPNTYRHSYWRGELTKDFIKSFFISETFAVHYWAATWMQ